MIQETSQQQGIFRLVVNTPIEFKTLLAKNSQRLGTSTIKDTLVRLCKAGSEFLDLKEELANLPKEDIDKKLADRIKQIATHTYIESASTHELKALNDFIRLELASRK